jgi:hypothetical protein
MRARRGVEFRRGWVACRKRRVEPGRGCAVHQPGTVQPILKLELHRQKQRKGLAAALLVEDAVGVAPAFVLRTHKDLRHFGDDQGAQERRGPASCVVYVQRPAPAPARVVNALDDGRHRDLDRKGVALGHVDALELRLQPVEIIFDDGFAECAGREHLIDARRLSDEGGIIEEVEVRCDAARGEARRHAPDSVESQIGGLIRKRAVGAGKQDRPGPVGFGVPVEEQPASQGQGALVLKGKGGVRRVGVAVAGSRPASAAVAIIDDMGHDFTSGRERGRCCCVRNGLFTDAQEEQTGLLKRNPRSLIQWVIYMPPCTPLPATSHDQTLSQPPSQPSGICETTTHLSDPCDTSSNDSRWPSDGFTRPNLFGGVHHIGQENQ